jgi:hypothetical protein
MHES